jgi:pimeloyl-ACP methyl ester carboxylesterase
MIDWYRALFRTSTERSVDLPIEIPTLLIWGANDTALRQAMAEPSIDLCTHGRLTVIEDATHWVHHEAVDRVNDLLLEFLEP